MTRVLIGFDGSDLAHRAAREGLQVLGPAASQVMVLRVVQPAVPPVVPSGGPMAPAVMPDDRILEESLESMVANARREADALAAALDATASAEVSVGDPGPEICRFAREGNFDVIVVGSHGTGVVKRVLVGSVSHHVLHHSPCPVLVVRSHGVEADDQPDPNPA